MTPRRLELHPLAIYEAIEAHQWYAQCGAQVADRFEREFNRAIDKIIDGPFTFGPTRHVILKKFPYSIVYCSNESVIRVLALAHASREPDYWQNRAGVQSTQINAETHTGLRE